jgi:hypothetical protein
MASASALSLPLTDPRNSLRAGESHHAAASRNSSLIIVK